MDSTGQEASSDRWVDIAGGASLVVICILVKPFCIESKGLETLLV